LWNAKQMSNSIGRITHRLKYVGILLGSAIRHDLQYGWTKLYRPSKKERLQFFFKTVEHQGAEISYDELRKILAQPSFGEIRHLDIFVGEPVLHHDVLTLGDIFTKSLPRLKSINFITKGVSHHIVLPQLISLAKALQAMGIGFIVSVSLDEISVSDTRKCMEDELNSIAAAIIMLEQSGLPVSIRYTLTPLNCQWADDILFWLEHHNIQDWAFRLEGDLILGSGEDCALDHTFSSEQKFHVAMFLDKLARHRRVELSRRIFYKRLVNQLLFDKPGNANYTWRTNCLTLDTLGNLDHRTLRESRKNYLCDMPDSASTRDLLKRGLEVVKGRYQETLGRDQTKTPTLLSVRPAKHNHPSEWKRVLITGWYGTETTGDKAILGEVLHFVKQHSPTAEIILTTLNRKISHQTSLELDDLAGASLVDIGKASSSALIESVDAVIVGGGPLMQTRAIQYIWRIFSEANRRQKARIIFGCGVGPLYTHEIRHMTTEVLQMSTAGFFRDQESYEYSRRLAPDGKFGVACDPALAYLQRWLDVNGSLKLHGRQQQSQISTLLRANTGEFIVDLGKKGLEDLNAQFAYKIAGILEQVCDTANAKAVLLAMNAPWVGGDDRLINRMVESSFTRPGALQVEREYFPLNKLIQSLAVSDAAIAMRYHGHLFCLALGIPFLSIDYTGTSGKVYSLIRRLGYEQWAEPWRDMDVERSARRLQMLLDEHVYWSDYLKQQSRNMVDLLHNTYSQVFDVARHQ